MHRRRRYIAVKVESDKTITEKEIFEAVRASILKLFGEYGASKTEFSLIKYRSKTHQAILCCSHKALDMVRVAIVAITNIEKKNAVIHIIRISGTLRSLKKHIFPGSKRIA